MSPLPEHILVVRATVDAEVEDEWNRWYDEKHLPEILGCPGFEHAARYVTQTSGKREYITLYGLTSPEAMRSEEFNTRRGWEQFAGHVQATVDQFTRVRS